MSHIKSFKAAFIIIVTGGLISHLNLSAQEKNSTAQNKSKQSLIVIDNRSHVDEAPVAPVMGPPLRNIYNASLSVGLGYTAAHFNNIDSSLDNGGLSYEGLVAFMLTAHYEASLKLFSQSNKPSSNPLDLVKSFHVGLGARQYFSQKRLTPFMSAHLHYGNYTVWPLQSEDTNSITFNRTSEGSSLGITPDIGLRFNANRLLAFDIKLSHIIYFGSPQYDLGGWNITLNTTLLQR